MKIRRKTSRAVALLLAVLLTVSLTACAQDQPDPSVVATVSTTATESPAQTSAPPMTTQPTTTVPAATETEPQLFHEGLKEIRQTMEPSAAIAAVIFLGYTETELTEDGFFWALDNQAALLKYPFILEISADRYIKNDGGQVFCIVPADPAAQVEVSFWNTTTDHPDHLAYSSESGEPVILHGNASDILPNLSITIVDSYGQTLLHYQPAISLNDEAGYVSVPTGNDDPVVLDLTGYPIDSQEPDETDPGQLFNEGLDEIRLAMEPSGAIASVIYLGYTDSTLEDDDFFHNLSNQTALLRYPFILETPLERFVKNDGAEVFCIVPAFPDSYVEIVCWDAETDQPGEVLYRSETGEPVIVQGNISDIMPNLGVTIVDRYGVLLSYYHPSISLKDGSVVTNEEPLVLDMSGR